VSDDIAGRPPSRARTLTVLLALASLASVVVAIWLGWVSAVVLPRVDPEHAGMWGFVAAALVGFSALCAAHLRVEGGSSAAGLRWGLLAASLAAIAFGVYVLCDTLNAARRGRHFEGYLLLIGLVLTVHGLLALSHAWISGRVPSAAAGIPE
jgi:hypothetical protein